MLARMNKVRLGLASVTLLAVTGLGVAPSAVADVTVPTEATPAVGMAYDTVREVLWFAGPGAQQGELVSADGDQVSISAELVSPQALAFADDRIWIGDIGDPNQDREFIVIYRLGVNAAGRTSYQAFDFIFPDGPLNATAFMISGKGRIYLATDGEDPGIYRAPAEPSRQSLNRLTRVADAPAGVTDGVFLDDGTTVALRTTAGIEYIDALSWRPTVTDTLVGAPADESIAADPNDTIFVGGNPVVRETDVPESDRQTVVGPASPEPTPTATTEPTASASASPSAVASPSATPAPSGAANRVGTFTALIVAAAVALICGAVAFFYRQ